MFAEAITILLVRILRIVSLAKICRILFLGLVIDDSYLHRSSTSSPILVLPSQLNVGKHKYPVSQPKCTSLGRSSDDTVCIVEVEEYGGERAYARGRGIHMSLTGYIRNSVSIFRKVASLGVMASETINGVIATTVLPVEGKQLGHFTSEALDTWEISEPTTGGLQALREAAKLLRSSNIPVAFPTETVYGLGADATRSEAVRGIYRAKGRPLDNPLIIHICDLDMLRGLLSGKQTNGHSCGDFIPAIYKPLIDRFWPGPLTILLPNPEHSLLAPEVTAGLKTFGARMPDSPLALSLIKLSGVPIAAPSANASTKPSTTTAEHVLHDLNGRIELILDGGSCQVGVESTIVDGLCDPPVILRPGGISISSIRSCQGWSNVKIAYKDVLEANGAAPRAPGMKYKHYSPKAKIILAERGANIVPQGMFDFRLDLVGNTDEASLLDLKGLSYDQTQTGIPKLPVIGVVRTKYWAPWGGFDESGWAHVVPLTGRSDSATNGTGFLKAVPREASLYSNDEMPILLARIVEISLGTDTKDIAHGLFSALRELDGRGVDVIYVEGIEDDADILENGEGEGEGGGVAAAIMNRLRKAAGVVRG